MSDLLLQPGPVLCTMSPTSESLNVTDRAHEFVENTVQLAENVTLADVFRLLGGNTALRERYRNLDVDAWWEEAQRCLAQPVRLQTFLDEQDAIDCLELSRSIRRHSRAGVDLCDRLDVLGLGPVLSRDVPEQGRRRGARMEWSVSLMPLEALLPLPIRLRPWVQVIENDSCAKAHGSEIARLPRASATLHEVIQGLLWELSYWGSPSQSRVVAKELHQRARDMEEGSFTTCSVDDLFDDMFRSACDAVFETLGGTSPWQVYRALCDIDDDEPVVHRFQQAFNGRVVVKASWAHLTGYELRRRFQAGDAGG